jgi:hypothetical protein
MAPLLWDFRLPKCMPSEFMFFNQILFEHVRLKPTMKRMKNLLVVWIILLVD